MVAWGDWAIDSRERASHVILDLPPTALHMLDIQILTGK
jgi:hypothetical protein